MRNAFACLAALLALVTAGPAAADTMRYDPGSVCHASLHAGETLADIAATSARWSCKGATFDWKQPTHVIRIDLRGTPVADEEPRALEFERHPFEKLTVDLLDGTEVVRSRHYDFASARIGESSMRTIIDLPHADKPVTALLVTVEGGLWPEAIVAADVRSAPSVPATAGLVHLLAALLCGLLLAPMIFDFGYYRALRETFPLYHALFCVMAFVQTAAVSGLIPLMSGIPYAIELDITYFSLDFLIAATFLFASQFVEPGVLSRGQRIALFSLAVITIVNGQATTYWGAELGEYVDHVFFGGYLLVLACYYSILVHARGVGSRTASYLMIGFGPLSAITLLQAWGIFVPALALTFDETWPQNLALLFEVVATALAVSDRFFAIRRERDKALTAARSLEELSERDGLTGLFNRRALESRYEDLVADGFHAVAVVDIDHFKSINDVYGHPVGDEVLRCAAAALSSADETDTVAFRIGGEEFLLLFRGTEAATRAEARRRAINSRVLARLEGFDRPVTASMGFLDFSAVAEQPEIDFTALYTRVDQLLYRAKCDGRNRMVAEHLELFEPDAGTAVAA